MCSRLSLTSGTNFDSPRQPPADRKMCIRRPPAEIWVTSGGRRQRFGSHPAAAGRDLGHIRRPPAQRKHHSPRSISRRFWEGSGAGNLRPPTSLARGGTLGYRRPRTKMSVDASGRELCRIQRPPARRCALLRRPSVRLISDVFLFPATQIHDKVHGHHPAVTRKPTSSVDSMYGPALQP